jgi:uncharacterized protein (TIGR03032 family)
MTQQQSYQESQPSLPIEITCSRHFYGQRISLAFTIYQTHRLFLIGMKEDGKLFISKLAQEDRCHLNGLAMVEGKPKYVTAVSQSDVTSGWRDKRTSGGCLIDIESNEVIATGLSMPHSPRYYHDRLWLLNSGTGEFGTLSLERGAFEPVTFWPGYLRGLAFYENFIIVGLSRPRDRTFTGLKLECL